MSELSLGSWVTYHNQVDTKAATEMLAAAFDAGVNFFDNAEVYAAGQSEVVMGEALRALKWPRLNYIVSTKFFWGLRDGPNEKNTLNRKYLMQAIDGSLERLGLDFVDLLYCHRADPKTPIEETLAALRDGSVLVADAAGNDLLRVWPGGTIRSEEAGASRPFCCFVSLLRCRNPLCSSFLQGEKRFC